jgi:predicted ATP-binding protein involved in virulence
LFKFGLSTIVKVVCDILDVLLSVEQDGINSLESTQAFVLIDELDAHLHPSWRLKILQAFRDAFPLIHFYISTHDPLILISLNEGELLILKVTEENKLIAVDDYPSLKGASIDQLLTSEMFGLQTTQDIETEISLNKYYEKLENVANESNDENPLITIEKAPSPEQFGIVTDTGITKRERFLMRLIDLEIAKHRNDASFSEFSSESVNSLFEKAKSLGMVDDL